MAKTVFILGAGASQKAGAPLMADFLDTARDLKGIKDDQIHFDRVFATIKKLRVIHFQSYIDLDNIESIFGAFEMGRLVNRLGDYSEEEIKEVNRSIKKLIVKTLEFSIKLPTRGNSAMPPEPYGDFVKMVRNIRSEGRVPACSILTFNYDIAVDYAFYCNNIPIDYCVSDDHAQSAFKLLKLHGSLNWGRCTKCHLVIPWYLKQYFSKFHFDIWPDTKFAYLTIGSHLEKYEHCDSPLSKEPVLVPPTWNKSEYHIDLSNVWSQAAKELSEAENIFVIGYSLPDSDLFFRYLFALGTVGIAHLRRFWIFDPDPKEEVKDRFEGLVGSGIRRSFRFEKKTFEEAIPIIKRELNINEEY